MQQIDFLTGFFSKEAMYAMLDKLQAEAKREHKPLTALLIDMDHFKTYNEKYGHLEGDNMLKYFAGILRTAMRDEQTFAFRFGGDEFIIVFPDKKAHEVYRIAHNMLRIFKKRPYQMGRNLLKLHFSAGIATYPTDGHRIEEVIHKADKAMYFSKTHGRAKVTICSHVSRKTLAKIICLVVCIMVSVVGAALYFSHNAYTDSAVSWLKKRAEKMGVSIGLPQIKIGAEPVRVYLKSGRVLKGTIRRDNEDEIELRLKFNTGSGTTTLKKSDINRIDKDQE